MADTDADLNVELPVSNGGAALFKAVEILSGEEKWDVIWTEKAKIMRFDEGENQWKDRGQGDAKIMKHKSESNRFMFVFRREAIQKLAAHHDLVKGMSAAKHPQSEKWVKWMAVKDYTDDEEGWEELFLIRFTSVELADAFLAEFNKICK